MKEKTNVVLVCIFLVSLVQLPLLLKVSPTIVRGDGVGYYVYLRSLFFDRDVDFSNEYAYYASALPAETQPLTSAFLNGPKTAARYPHNPWPVGPAILWSPFFLMGHLVAMLAGWLGLPVAADGYSLPYQCGVAVGSAVYGFAGLVLVYMLCRDHCRVSNCLLALFLVWFATSLTAYMYFMPSMSHSVAFFCSSAFICAWYRTRNKRSVVAWGGLGMLGGLMALQRIQDSVFVLVVAVEICSSLVELIRLKRWNQIWSLVMLVLVFGAGMMLMFLPQIFVWRALYGKMLPNAQQESMGFTFDWLHPRIVQVLFSSRHGLLSWTPVVAFGLAGTTLFYRKDKLLTLALILVFLMQLYVVSCWPHWHQGASFGGRMFVSCSAVFVLGLAALIEWLGRSVSLRWIALVGSLFILWNYILLYQYGTGMISRVEAVYWPQVISNAVVIAVGFVGRLIGLLS